MRELCHKCQQRPQAINYYKNGRVYYRRLCDPCTRNRPNSQPLWKQHGYKKKNLCDRCGFTSKFSEQFNVIHIDNNLKNCLPTNLKTVCANCQRILQRTGERWKQGDLVPDKPQNSVSRN